MSRLGNCFHVEAGTFEYGFGDFLSRIDGR
jgi:hypothetical protein